jgi:hypothetical protein
MDLRRKTNFNHLGKAVILRAGIACLLAVSCVSCAVTETKPKAASISTSGIVGTAWSTYSHRDYAGAVSAFDQVISNKASSNDQQRQAWLGKALVYLSTDPDWRDLDKARAAVQSASDISTGNESQSAGVNFFGSAVEGHINAESDNAELNAKVTELLRELEQSKSSLADLEAENKTLRAEQENLNVALEKLKELTLGN